MAQMKLEVVTPTGAVVEAEAESVTAPGVEGEFGVLPDHRPALIMLGGGTLRYAGPQGEGAVLIRGGIAEVAADRVLVLADEAVLPGEGDAARADALLEGVEEAVRGGDYLDDEALARLAIDRGFAESLRSAKG